MSSPKNPRKKRSSRINIQEFNSSRREKNLRHEIRITEKKMDKLLKRNRLGKPATSSKKKIWDDTHKNIVKVIELKKLQGFKPDSERHKKMLAHVNSLKEDLQK